MEQQPVVPRHASTRRPATRKPKESHTKNTGGHPKREHPAGRLDRVWPDTGPNESVSQPRHGLRMAHERSNARPAEPRAPLPGRHHVENRHHGPMLDVRGNRAGPARGPPWSYASAPQPVADSLVDRRVGPRRPGAPAEDMLERDRRTDSRRAPREGFGVDRASGRVLATAAGCSRCGGKRCPGRTWS
jgi:hypothetical protein